MVSDVFMPDLSTLDFTMETGVIAEWLKKDGEHVEKEEPLLEVETAKVVIEIKSPASGILKILKPKGTEVPVGEKIAEVT